MIDGKMIWRWLRRVWMSLGILATAALFIGVRADGVPDSVVRTDGRVIVRAEADGTQFQPVRTSGAAGLIFLPGAMVEPRAYAPLLRAAAEAGFRVELINLPYRCAFTAGQKTSVFDSIERRITSSPKLRWVVAGHSRGGALAAQFVHQRAVPVQGLVLIGTTHPRDFDLSRVAIPVTRIYGTLDGVAPLDAMRRNAHLLPGTTRWVAIEGGNHTQFAWYRFQLGDNRAAVTRERQQAETLRALLAALGG